MQEAALQPSTKGNYEPKREHTGSTEEVLSVVLLKEKGRHHHQVKGCRSPGGGSKGCEKSSKTGGHIGTWPGGVPHHQELRQAM
ncbi:hypothetical protein CYMTET_56504 [Cymbomonas tetramitiformis]|uniref:Uncharacterized protein n=1 Tax=Cymbomonas tetramitiformis TaxID=36881 RepID=A0AAE0BAU0_9CHLO|nr:hypothetical protein CYMTET_56504 [Cymbomonas tetramitiformis]